ncbi:MAG: hypothetical protein ACE145_13665 [Terriglobia bacterium]
MPTLKTQGRWLIDEGRMTILFSPSNCLDFDPGTLASPADKLQAVARLCENPNITVSDIRDFLTIVKVNHE